MSLSPSRSHLVLTSAALVRSHKLSVAQMDIVLFFSIAVTGRAHPDNVELKGSLVTI